MLFKLKTGMGKHRIRRNGRMIVLKPGDEIDCNRHELGGAIDKFEQMEPDPPPPKPRAGLKMKPRGSGWYDVFNEKTGKKINDKPIKKQDAIKLVGESAEQEGENKETETAKVKGD